MQKKINKNTKEVRKKINTGEMTTKLVYLDNAATSLKTDEFIEILCNSYEDTDWLFKKEEICESLLNELSELLQTSVENISLVPSSTYAINEIWEHILEVKKGKTFSIYIQKEDHISNISSIEHLKNSGINNSFELKYFFPENIESIQLQSNDVILITLIDNLGINIFSKKYIELLREKNPETIIIGDFTQYMTFWDRDKNLSSFFDFFYFSAHKFFGLPGLGLIVSKGSELSRKINSRENYLLDLRSIYVYEKTLKKLKNWDLQDRKKKEVQLKNFWIENFPKLPKLSYLCENDSLIFLVSFDSEYLHDFLYFLESQNIIFRAYDLCNNNSVVLKRQIRFSLSFLNSVEDLKILFDSFQQFFKLELN